MAEIVLFHSVLGINPGIGSAAKRLEEAGHKVHVPNLYEAGKIFDDYNEAQRYADQIGYAGLLERSRNAVSKLPGKLVYAGFSNGGAPAEYLALTRPGALGALLFHASLPLPMFGQLTGEYIESWPPDVPVQVHYSKDDPSRNQEWVDSFARSVKDSGSPYTFYEYPGSGHQFADVSRSSEYEAVSAELLWKRALNFLDLL